jgi:hypothetical protein
MGETPHFASLDPVAAFCQPSRTVRTHPPKESRRWPGRGR